MEIKVRCRKDGDTWTIEDPGPAFVTDYHVTWKFKGLEPGIVPLLAFKENQPFGPFYSAQFTATAITAKLEELSDTPTVHHCSLVLVQWKPDGSEAIATRSQELRFRKPRYFPITVTWQGPGIEPTVEPELCEVGAGCQVEWLFENVPADVFTSVDFKEWTPNGPPELRPLGPFAELYGENVNGKYRLTGWTDSKRALYTYAVSFYNRKTCELITCPDPKIDNNGEPPGEEHWPGEEH